MTRTFGAATVLAHKSLTKTVNDRKMKYEAQLIHLHPNPRPYFSITGETWDRIDGRWYEGSCGAIHETILQWFPDTAQAIALHLSDDDGVPLHAEANAHYWAGHTRWTGYNEQALMRHLRCNVTEARELRDTPYEAAFAAIIDSMRARWKAEAEGVLAWLNQ